MRVGGPFLLDNGQQRPTLAANASRWAISTWQRMPTTTTAHPRCKCESVGRFYLTMDNNGPPSLQTRVGGPFLLGNGCLRQQRPTLAAKASRWADSMTNWPKRTSFGPR